MKSITLLPLAVVVAIASMVQQTRQMTPSPANTPFSSSFQQPNPPTLQSEFKASWKQHKWYHRLHPHP